MEMFQGETGFLEELTGVSGGLLPPESGQNLGSNVDNITSQQLNVVQNQNLHYGFDNFVSQGGISQLQQGINTNSNPDVNPPGGGNMGMISPNQQYVNPQVEQPGQIQNMGYQSYQAQNTGNTCMTPPRPQQSQQQQTAQSPMWNQSTSAQNAQQSFIGDGSQQQNSQQQLAFQNNTIANNSLYVSQHDYAMPTNNMHIAPQQNAQKVATFQDNQSMQTSQQQMQNMSSQSSVNSFQMHSPQQSSMNQLSTSTGQVCSMNQQQGSVNQVQSVPVQSYSIQGNAIQVQGGNMQQSQTMAIQAQGQQPVQQLQIQSSNVGHVIARGAGQPIRIQQLQGSPGVIRLQQVQQGNQIVLQGQGVTQRLAQLPLSNQALQLTNLNQQGQTFVLSQPSNSQGSILGGSQQGPNQIRIVNVNGSLANLSGIQIRPVYTTASAVAQNQPSLAASSRPTLQMVTQQTPDGQNIQQQSVAGTGSMEGSQSSAQQTSVQLSTTNQTLQQNIPIRIQQLQQQLNQLSSNPHDNQQRVMEIQVSGARSDMERDLK